MCDLSHLVTAREVLAIQVSVSCCSNPTTGFDHEEPGPPVLARRAGHLLNSVPLVVRCLASTFPPFESLA